MSKTTTRIDKVGTVVVPVSDQDRAVAFYVDTLGFEKRTDVPFGNGYRWVEVAPEASRPRSPSCRRRPASRPATSRPASACNTSDIDALYAELKDAGVDVDDEVSRMGDPVPPLFWFRDPDNNTPDGRRDPLSCCPVVLGLGVRRARAPSIDEIRANPKPRELVARGLEHGADPSRKLGTDSHRKSTGRPPWSRPLGREATLDSRRAPAAGHREDCSAYMAAREA